MTATVTIPTQTIEHTISVDDDYDQTRAICTCGTLIYNGSDRNAKMAATYQHLADVFSGLA